VKRAEDGAGLVVRAYEPYGVEAEDSFDVEGLVQEADMLERNRREASMAFKPWEVKTLHFSSWNHLPGEGK
jgi:alpha-mannosidase